MHKIITEIINSKKKELEKSKAILSEKNIIEKASALKERTRPFENNIKGKTDLSLIAEVKQASPIKGIIRKKFDPVEIAKTYQRKGAAAVSVVTESNYFKGELEHLRAVKEAVNLPVLRKDFIFDTYQIYESYLAGADCVLLIVKIVQPGILSRLFNLTKSLGMHALVEIHSEEELETALKTNASIIGINNRNLDNFSVEIDTSRRLAQYVPKDKIVVSESGIESNEDIELLRAYGFDAVLIGEAFLKEESIEKAIDNIWY